MNKGHVTKLARKYASSLVTPSGLRGFTDEDLLAFANALEDSVYQRLKTRALTDATVIFNQLADATTLRSDPSPLIKAEVFEATKSAAIECCREQDLRTRKLIADLNAAEVLK